MSQDKGNDLAFTDFEGALIPSNPPSGSPSPSRDNTDLRDAVDMHVGLAVHRFNAAQGTVILSACTVESVDAIMALIADETAKARIDECRRFGELTGYEDYASDRIAQLRHNTNTGKEES